jgi:hypothetical protein
MHQCEEFRERITEHIIDREDLAANAEFHHELLICSACSEFYAESREMIDALSTVDLNISERQWDGIEYRLRMRIVNESTVAAVYDRRKTGAHRASLQFAFAAAAMLLMTIGLYRLTTPLVNTQRVAAPQTVYVDHSVPLDPVTVDFLEESELLLRNVMKITPTDVDDLVEAKQTADGQLADIAQRKEAAADVPPVVDVMDTYETILRDLRNLDEKSAAEDIADIQSRIRKNGLIANIKSFQPSVTTVTPVSFDFR